MTEQHNRTSWRQHLELFNNHEKNHKLQNDKLNQELGEANAKIEKLENLLRHQKSTVQR